MKHTPTDPGPVWLPNHRPELAGNELVLGACLAEQVENDVEVGATPLVAAKRSSGPASMALLARYCSERDRGALLGLDLDHASRTSITGLIDSSEPTSLPHRDAAPRRR